MITLLSKLTNQNLRLLSVTAFCLLAITLNLPLPAYALDQSPAQWYQVELIVFSRYQEEAAAEAKRTEEASFSSHWPPSQAIPLQPSTLNDNNDHADNTKSYYLLPRSAFLLTHEEKQLAKSNDYQLLAHIAWQQPINKGTLAKPIYFIAGETYDKEGNTLSSDPITDTEAGVFHEIEGVLKISQQRYIDISAVIHVLRPTTSLPFDFFDPSQINANNPLLPKGYQALSLNQSIRMRVNQISYFDHPFFGVLVKVIPVEKSSLPTPPSNNAASPQAQ